MFIAKACPMQVAGWPLATLIGVVPAWRNGLLDPPRPYGQALRTFGFGTNIK